MAKFKNILMSALGVLLGFIVVMMLFFGVSLYRKRGVSGRLIPKARVCFKEKCFFVEIADDPQEHQKGLMFRESMPEDHGMLFVFNEDGYYAFWMKNTLIPLDMIWLDQDKKVVYIEESVPPCEGEPCPSYSPGVVSARYVLELNAGMAEKIGLKINDVMRLK